jgi:hypothetical protein
VDPRVRATVTPPVLKSLAEVALAVLARHEQGPTASEKAGSTERNGRQWRFETKTPEGMRFEIRLTGPDVPATIPDTVVAASEIPRNIGWRETYRLVVSPPLIALDLGWRADGPLRIMTFSRGDWEAQLLEVTRRQAAAPAAPRTSP